MVFINNEHFRFLFQKYLLTRTLTFLSSFSSLQWKEVILHVRSQIMVNLASSQNLLDRNLQFQMETAKRV